MTLNLKPFTGEHCETTTTGTLLNHLNLDFSEPMLFGLGEGLSYIYWNTKTMDFPFLGGRIKPDHLTLNITRNLNLTYNVQETTSQTKAWHNVKTLIDNNQPVGLKLDCFHLEYFTNPIHFAGHYVTLIGYDHNKAYLVDTKQQGTLVETSLSSLASARNEKGLMSSKNLHYTIEQHNPLPHLPSVILQSINHNAHSYLNPPITNSSHKGIRKTSKELPKWFNTAGNDTQQLVTLADIMEKGGTGGNLFRNLYKKFLQEAYDVTSIVEIKKAADNFTNIANLWSETIELIKQSGQTQQITPLLQASKILEQIADMEEKTMTQLAACSQTSQPNSAK